METKKQRSAPHVWKRVWKLRPCDSFYLGKTLFGYVGFFCVATGPRDKLKFVLPWRRVRTTELVKPSPIVGTIAKVLSANSPFLNCVSPESKPFRVEDYLGEAEVFHCPRVETADPAPIPPGYEPPH